MTNRLELNWKLDGFVDEQRYYCSETPIDPMNPPAPKLILTGDVRTHVDTDIEVGNTYHVCIGSVKGNIEKFSEVEVVIAQGKIYRVQLSVDNSNNLLSYGTLPLTWGESAVNLLHDNNEIQHTSAASYIKTSENFNWSGAWDIEFDVYIDSSVSNSYKTIVSNSYNQWNFGGLFIYYGDTGAGSYELNRFGIGNYAANGIMSNVMAKDTWHHVRCQKTTDHKYTMLVNDVTQFSNTSPNIANRIPIDGIINLGYIAGGISGAGVKIRNFIIH